MGPGYEAGEFIRMYKKSIESREKPWMSTAYLQAIYQYLSSKVAEALSGKVTIPRGRSGTS
jgi:hypothetical protein